VARSSRQTLNNAMQSTPFSSFSASGGIWQGSRNVVTWPTARNILQGADIDPPRPRHTQRESVHFFTINAILDGSRYSISTVTVTVTVTASFRSRNFKRAKSLGSTPTYLHLNFFCVARQQNTMNRI
jgi:hypothetical protein